MNRYTWGTFTGQTCSKFAAVWTMTKRPTLYVMWLFMFFLATVNVHQLSGCLSNRTVRTSEFWVSSDVYDCVSELKEKLFVKTVCKGNTSWYPSKRNLRTSSSVLSSDWLRPAGGLKMRFTGTLQKASNQPREPETRTQREKGKPKPPIAVGRLSEKGKEELLCTVFICR